MVCSVAYAENLICRTGTHTEIKSDMIDRPLKRKNQDRNCEKTKKKKRSNDVSEEKKMYIRGHFDAEREAYIALSVRL